MVTPSLHKHFKSRGVKLLPVAVGAAAFVAELSGRGDVDVVIGSNTDVSFAPPLRSHGRLRPNSTVRAMRAGPERDGRFVSDLFPPIAIVGQGCVLPGTLTPEGLWSLVEGGRSAISRVPEELWRLAPSADRKALARAIASDVGGYVSGFDEVFDAGGFLIAPEDLAGLDPVFLLTLHAAREAPPLGGHGNRCPLRAGHGRARQPRISHTGTGGVRTRSLGRRATHRRRPQSLPVGVATSSWLEHWASAAAASP